MELHDCKLRETLIDPQILLYEGAIIDGHATSPEENIPFKWVMCVTKKTNPNERGQENLGVVHLSDNEDELPDIEVPEQNNALENEFIPLPTVQEEKKVPRSLKTLLNLMPQREVEEPENWEQDEIDSIREAETESANSENNEDLEREQEENFYDQIEKSSLPTELKVHLEKECKLFFDKHEVKSSEEHIIHSFADLDKSSTSKEGRNVNVLSPGKEIGTFISTVSIPVENDSSNVIGTQKMVRAQVWENLEMKAKINRELRKLGTSLEDQEFISDTYRRTRCPKRKFPSPEIPVIKVKKSKKKGNDAEKKD